MEWIIGIYAVGVLVHGFLVGTVKPDPAEFNDNLILCLFWPVLFAMVAGESWRNARGRS